jgi:tRNA-dihydrouridine synthase
MQGGMGAALLQQSENACSIIKALRDNLTIPGIYIIKDIKLILYYNVFVIVTAKIRLLDTVEETVSFMQNLERAGVSAITGIVMLILYVNE